MVAPVRPKFALSSGSLPSLGHNARFWIFSAGIFRGSQKETRGWPLQARNPASPPFSSVTFKHELLQSSNPKTSISSTLKVSLPVKKLTAFSPAGHSYELLSFAVQLLALGALGMTRSEPLPNVGPKPLLRKIACSSFPSIKGIFVGGKSFVLTRLNRKDSVDSP